MIYYRKKKEKASHLRFYFSDDEQDQQTAGNEPEAKTETPEASPADNSKSDSEGI